MTVPSTRTAFAHACEESIDKHYFDWYCIARGTSPVALDFLQRYHAGRSMDRHCHRHRHLVCIFCVFSSETHCLMGMIHSVAVEDGLKNLTL